MIINTFATDNRMVAISDVPNELNGLGFERIDLLPGSTFQDSSTIIIIPTRGMVHHKVISAWQGMMAPMNQKRSVIFVAGEEVGIAYNRLIENILAHPELSKWKYVLTLEDDNLPPPDAHIRLLESINQDTKFDAVSGLYWTKGDYNMPMAYGDPDEFRNTGQLLFGPRDVRKAIEHGHVMEVNGIAMGCALWRLEMFRQITGPWFCTVNDIVPEKGVMLMTQDLYFCKKAREVGKRFAVDCRVKVGHMDVATGIVY